MIDYDISYEFLIIYLENIMKRFSLKFIIVLLCNIKVIIR